MTVDTAAPRSRRTLLAAGLGGALATVASALGRPQAARAANGDPIVIGQANTGTAETTLTQETASTSALIIQGVAGNTALVVHSPSHIGVYATTTSGTGVAGEATTGIGIHGTSEQSYGVRGSTSLIGGTGVGGMAPGTLTGVFGFSGTGLPSTPTVAAGTYGRSDVGIGARGDGPTAGVVGYSGTALDNVPFVSAKTGVYGYANQDAAAIGVSGRSGVGKGVFGIATDGIGVQGTSTNNTGLRGDSTNGTAVRAFSTHGRAINATSGGATAPGISSQSTGGMAAIQGFCGGGAVPLAASETGVHGRCDTSGISVGVLGESNIGYGVTGSGYYGVWGTGASGVTGDVDGGTGVQGWTGLDLAPAPVAHVGVWAGADNGRVALQVQGVAKFNRSGLASFAAGTSSKKITVPGGITATSFALGTIQANRAGIWVRAVVPATADSSITIYLNTTVASTTNVGWLVIG